MSRPTPLPVTLTLSVAGALLVASSFASAGGGQVSVPLIGGHANARPPVTVVQPIHPAGPNLGHTIIRPAVPPVFFNPVVPGVVTFAPPVVVVVPSHAPGPAPVQVPGPAPMHLPGPPPVHHVPANASVQPLPPAIAPSSPIFFAPPVQQIGTPAHGQVLIIRRTSH